MIIDHVALVVPNLEKGIENWSKMFGYEVMTKPIVNTQQKVRVVFLKKEGSICIKLVEPTDDKSPVFNLARRGGGLHHLCFLCDNVESSIKELESQGARILSHPQPGEAFGLETIAFCYCEPGLNAEFIDTTTKAGILIG